MDINSVLTDLKAELNRVTQAIAALEILPRLGNLWVSSGLSLEFD
jgi:hypothetical protein